MAGIDSQGEQVHARYREYARWALHGEWDNQDGQQREGTSAPQSTQHHTQCPYRGRSDVRVGEHQESSDG